MRRFILRENIKRFQRMLMDAKHDQERSRLEVFLSEARQELTFLEQLWLVTCPQLGIPPLLGSEAEDILDRAVIAHHADFGSLQIWEEAEQCLYLIAQTNFDHTLVDRFATVRQGDGTVYRILQDSKATIIIEDIEKDDASASLRNWTASAGIRAIICSPLFGTEEISWEHFPPTTPSRYLFPMNKAN